MKNLYFILFILSSIFSSNLMADSGSCNWNASFKYPQANKHYAQGKSIYVNVNPQKHQDIAYMECYVDGKFIRKETSYPYEWAKGSSGDNYLRNLSCGKHHIKVKIVDKCGDVHYKEIYIYIDCHDNGGGHCEWDAWFKSPKANAHYAQRKPVYIRVDPKKYQDIAYMECFVDGKFIRKETSYPYEWAKGSSGDNYLRNLTCGKHHIKVKIVDKCGDVHYKEIYIYIDCHDNGGGHKPNPSHCEWDAWFKYPKANAHYAQRKPVYIRVDPKKYQDIAYMECYVDGKFIRKETSYPYEWCKGSSGDNYLRNLTCGKHHIKVKVVDKCGDVHYKEIYIYIDCHDNGGGHKPNPGQCESDAWFKYPKSNQTFRYRRPVYIRVDPKKYQDIAYMECYVDGKFIRKETAYPYEWCKGSSGDNYLRNLSRGYHHIKVKIVDKCGQVKYEQTKIRIQ